MILKIRITKQDYQLILTALRAAKSTYPQYADNYKKTIIKLEAAKKTMEEKDAQL